MELKGGGWCGSPNHLKVPFRPSMGWYVPSRGLIRGSSSPKGILSLSLSQFFKVLGFFPYLWGGIITFHSRNFNEPLIMYSLRLFLLFLSFQWYIAYFIWSCHEEFIFQIEGNKMPIGVQGHVLWMVVKCDELFVCSQVLGGLVSYL